MTPSSSFSSLAEFAFAMDLGDGSRESHFYSQWDDTLPANQEEPRPRLDSCSDDESESALQERERQQRSRASKQVQKLLLGAHRSRPVVGKARPDGEGGKNPLVTPPVRIPTMSSLRADESG